MNRIVLSMLLIVTSIIGQAQASSKGVIELDAFQNNNDSIYFSVMSGCNIGISFKPGKKAESLFNGNLYFGQVAPNAYTAGLFDFRVSGKTLFNFRMDGKVLLILNQKYEIGCEPAKAVELSRLVTDTEAIAAFDDYANSNTFLWDNVSDVNDKAYFLGELKFYSASVHVLEQVVSKSPKRAVAWLNLGDALWATNQKAKAAHAYGKYLECVGNNEREKQAIPQRVYQRIKPKE
ncbi:MAG: hypothetical protein EOP06_12180 [Proteobacteria bacterium]|nr:MAG: hypothetical protein EOP06_12180 [Pseudomonadota bacterium]